MTCDDECTANGGKCIGPGKCECPQGKFGYNCEKRKWTYYISEKWMLLRKHLFNANNAILIVMKIYFLF